MAEISQSRFRAVIFDCFGVFYVDPVLAYMHDSGSPAEIAEALHSLDEQAALGKLTKAQFDVQAGALLHEAPATMERRFFQGKERNEALVAYAQNLRPRYKIGLLSNLGSDMMDGFFAPVERRNLFDEVIISGDVRLAKPDPAIFKLMCARMDVKPTEAVMIDDIEDNCAAARSLGMAAIRYGSFTQMKAELEALLNS